MTGNENPPRRADPDSSAAAPGACCPAAPGTISGTQRHRRPTITAPRIPRLPLHELPVLPPPTRAAPPQRLPLPVDQSSLNLSPEPCAPAPWPSPTSGAVTRTVVPHRGYLCPWSHTPNPNQHPDYPCPWCHTPNPNQRPDYPCPWCHSPSLNPASGALRTEATTRSTTTRHCCQSRHHHYYWHSPNHPEPPDPADPPGLAVADPPPNNARLIPAAAAMT